MTSRSLVSTIEASDAPLVDAPAPRTDPPAGVPSPPAAPLPPTTAHRESVSPPAPTAAPGLTPAASKPQPLLAASDRLPLVNIVGAEPVQAPTPGVIQPGLDAPRRTPADEAPSGDSAPDVATAPPSTDRPAHDQPRQDPDQPPKTSASPESTFDQPATPVTEWPPTPRSPMAERLEAANPPSVLPAQAIEPASGERSVVAQSELVLPPPGSASPAPTHTRLGEGKSASPQVEAATSPSVVIGSIEIVNSAPATSRPDALASLGDRRQHGRRYARRQR